MKILKLSHQTHKVRVELSLKEIMQIRKLLFDVRTEHLEDGSYAELLADLTVTERLLDSGRLDNFDTCHASYLQNIVHPNNNEIYQQLHETYTTNDNGKR